MTRRARRWLLALLAVLALAECRSESDGASSATTTTTAITYPPTMPNPPTTYRTVLPATTTRTAPSTTTTAPGVVDRLGLPATVSNGSFLRLRARCPYGSDYVYLGLDFTTPEGEPTIPGGVGVSAPTSAHVGQQGDGTVEAYVGLNLPPGRYVVQVAGAECWKHDGRILMVVQSEAGFSSLWERPEAAVASVEPVIRGSDGCVAR